MFNKSIEFFPFEFTELPTNNSSQLKCPFIQNVETILATDLQAYDSFGCRIKNCHTHAGSKVHFKDFIEAELLFHNSYYNHGFATLTVEEIEKKLNSDKNSYKKVLLIGYESYSELYLQEVRSLLAKRHDEFECDYCVYETIAMIKDNGERIIEAEIRNLYKNNNDTINEINKVAPSFYIYYGFNSNAMKNALTLQDTLLVFIVPINTTLSTMDKMISLFKQRLDIKDDIASNSLLLCLITIGPDDKKQEKNYYWTNKNNHLIPNNDRFIEINQKNAIRTFAFVKSHWMYNNKEAMLKQTAINLGTNHKKMDDATEFCVDCFPDCNNESLLVEKPIFDVTRGSVVPMLQLGRNIYLKPIEKTKTIYQEKNLRRIWKLSNHMAYRHIVRGDNHFQYYFDAIGFVNQERECTISSDMQNDLVDYLQNIKKDFDLSDNNQQVVYNYIVAPRHETNAKWVDLVCNTVFSGEPVNGKYNPEYDGARVLYFDVTKEYRSNVHAKYSDFYCTIENIKKSGRNCEIRFHYVDETITSGSNFIRAIDLIRSLVTGIDFPEQKNFKISLFHSVFLLYGRSSSETKMFYMNLLNDVNLDNESKELLMKHFYEYVHINVSTMRSHEDACTLCKLANDYRKVRAYCATNEMANICSDVIYDHKIYYIESIENKPKHEPPFQCSIEKRMVFFISHLLNQRICYNNKPIFPKEKNKTQIDIESIYAGEKIAEILYDYYENAYKWLNDAKIITEGEESYKVAFIKAISRPFFVFHLRKRQAAFSFCLKLLDSLIKKEDLTLEEQKQLMALVKALVDMNANYLIREKQFIKLLNIAKKTNTNWSGFDKKLFNEINFAHCIKKMISLTQDTTKSILLEHILVEGSEKGFFNKPVDKQLRCSSFCCSEFLTTQGLMYLENNRIIIDALKDIENNRVALSNKFPYFFDNFGNICKLNNNEQIIKQFELFQKKYQDVIKTLKSEKIEYIDARINSWIKSMLGKDELKVVSFIKDTDVFYNNNDFNKLFEFFMLAELSEKSKEICENFYSNTNRKKIHNLLCRENNMCVYFDSDFVLIEFKKEKETSSENKDTNDIIYLQITGFDTKKIEHWFILKMLFTLRSTFAKLIKHIKLPLLISERSKKMRESALRIVKALTHSNRASYMNMNFFTEQTEYPLAESSLNIPIGEEKFPLEKYLQLISNEWISSLYRKIVRGDLNEDLYNHFNGPITPSIRADYQKEMLKNFWGLKTATPSYIMHIYNESKFEAVRIIFKGLDYFDNFKYAAILPQMASMESIVMVITLMAENVIKHNNKVNNQEYELTVECTTDGDLMFYNESDFSPDMLNNINDIIECPPWVYGCANSNMQTPHITLWTFAHIATIISNIEADGQKEPLFPNFNFVVQNANGRFEVIFEHFFK